MEKKVIFLDRDGTLIEEVDFLATVEETRLFNFTVEALSILRAAGFEFVVTTNQSGIARGYFDEAAVDAIHQRIQEKLNESGLRIESFQYCPHFPDAGCACRKPGTGMIEMAVDGQSVDLANSWVIGDKILDVNMGRNAGTRSALVMTGYGMAHRKEIDWTPDIMAENLLAAAKEIVKNIDRESQE